MTRADTVVTFAVAESLFAVEVGIVDQALPSHGGTGLFEINPHYQKKAVLQFGGKLGKAFGILAA